MQKTRLHSNICRLFASAYPPVPDFKLCAHRFQNIKDTGTRRIDPDMIQQQAAARHNRPCYQPISRRTDVSRNMNGFRCPKGPDRMNRNRIPLALHFCTKSFQHLLSMIPRPERLNDGRIAIGIHPSQQQSGFNLSTGYGALIRNPMKFFR